MSKQTDRIAAQQALPHLDRALEALDCIVLESLPSFEADALARAHAMLEDVDARLMAQAHDPDDQESEDAQG